MISMLTGCGNDTTKITEGMQLVETLDYQGALTAFDEAEAQKENSRLIARGRGIASMGLTEYDQAVQYFTEALELSDGWVQNVDYDMNYYLAAAYRKNGQPAEAKKVYDAILGLKPEEKDAYSCGDRRNWNWEITRVPRRISTRQSLWTRKITTG